MSWKSKVVWSEGLFLRPQHFQQQGRYFESFVETRCGSLRPYAWGFTELKIDADLLSIGKLAIASASGVFPDGTPFSIPESDEPPVPMDIGSNVHNEMYYLCLATRKPDAKDFGISEGESLIRYKIREHEARDSDSPLDTSAQMQVGSLFTRLLADSDQRADYACLGVARVIESRVDKQVVLDDAYIPPTLSCGSVRRLAGFVTELQGLLNHRGEAISHRVSDAGKGGAAEVAEFLMLQLVNRYQPVFSHLAALPALHPEEFFRLLLELAGELATFTNTTKRPQQFPTYRHDDLQLTFEPVIKAIRESLSMVIEQTAIPIPLKEKRFGIRVGALSDPALLDQASFVLAVNANMPVEDLRSFFPAQVKIGSVENIRDLVNSALPGIVVRALPVAPRQIPFHAGYVYFELDRASEYWAGLKNSGGFALHVGGDFPGLKMEFWAIRG
jgi:type VI secretion system protein ImpJ